MAITREQISVELRLLSTEFSKGLKKINKDLSKTNFGKFSKNFKKGFDNIEVGMGGTLNQVGKLKGATQRLGQQFGTATKMMQGFRMEFLGIMFGGMMIQRIFQGIIQSAKETFMKISEGATPAGKAITALGAEMTFLKFTIGRVLGEALLPMLPAIIEIIRNVREWVKQNPKLASGLIVAGMVLGLLLFTLGSFSLLLSSVTNLFGPKGFAGAMVKALGGGVLGFVKLFGITFAFSILILAIIDTIILWKTDWKSAMKSMAIAVLALGAVVAIAVGGIAALWIIVGAVFLATIVMIVAEWKKLWLGLRFIADSAGNAILDGVQWLVNNWLESMEPIFFIMKKLGLISVSPRADFSGLKRDLSFFDREIAAMAAEEAANEGQGPQGLTQQLLGFLTPGAIEDLFNQPENIPSSPGGDSTTFNGDINLNLPEGTDFDASTFLDTLEEEIRRRQGQ